MKKYLINPFVRVILIIGGFLLIVDLFSTLSWWVINYQQHLSAQEEPPAANTHQALVGRLTYLGDGQMQGTMTSLLADTSVPAAMYLPVASAAAFAKAPKVNQVKIITNKGELQVELYPQSAPLAVGSFLSLAQQGFYNQCKIHRHEPGFVVQMGDLASKNAQSAAELLSLGTGYPGYRVSDEFSVGGDHSFATVGALGLANLNYEGKYPHSGGSQFFITLSAAPELDGKYTLFGQVTAGWEVLAQLSLGDEIIQITYEEDIKDNR